MLHVFTFYKFEKLLIIHFTGIVHDNFMVSIKSNPNVKKLQKNSRQFDSTCHDVQTLSDENKCGWKMFSHFAWVMRLPTEFL